MYFAVICRRPVSRFERCLGSCRTPTNTQDIKNMILGNDTCFQQGRRTFAEKSSDLPQWTRQRIMQSKEVIEGGLQKKHGAACRRDHLESTESRPKAVTTFCREFHVDTFPVRCYWRTVSMISSMFSASLVSNRFQCKDFHKENLPS